MHQDNEALIVPFPADDHEDDIPTPTSPCRELIQSNKLVISIRFVTLLCTLVSLITNGYAYRAEEPSEARNFSYGAIASEICTLILLCATFELDRKKLRDVNALHRNVNCLSSQTAPMILAYCVDILLMTATFGAFAFNVIAVLSVSLGGAAAGATALNLASSLFQAIASPLICHAMYNSDERQNPVEEMQPLMDGANVLVAGQNQL